MSRGVLWGGRRRGRGGVREDIGPDVFRSSWEANFARYLKLCKEGGSIKDWSYEPESFPVTIGGKQRRYTPDFRVEYHGSLVHYVEVKGYMDTRSRQKISALRKQRPDINLWILGKTAYAYATKEIAPEIKNWER